jgi:hypothetical protein
MIIVRLIEVLGKIMKLPKNSYLDPTTLGSGTPSSSNYLRGDGTWATPSSSGGGMKSGTATASVTDTYTTTITGVTSYAVNDSYIIKFNTNNVNGATLNINGLGAINLVKNNDVIITGGDIRVGQEFVVVYDGTNFQMIGIAPNQMFAYVTNADSVTINKGQPVYAFSAAGDRMSVKLAYNTSDATSAKTVGLVFSSSIAPNGTGFIITQGVIQNLNTAAYSPGDTLYLGSTAGSLTKVKPYAPNHLVYIGIVERANAGNGQIYVKTQNGYELDEIHDVDLITTPPVANNVLTYNGSLWVPRTISPVAGGTLVFVAQKSDLPTPSAGVITLADGVTYFFTDEVDLTGDRLVCGINTTILGGSSENCRIKSTGLVGTALITSNYSLPMRNITIEANVALNLDGDGVNTAIDWFGVNFTDCATIGTVRDYTNFIMQDSAFLNSGNMTFDGTIGTIGATQCLFNCNASGTAFILAPTLTVTRRFRIVYSSFIILAGEKAIDTNPAPTIPDDGFILNYCNFSGGGTYLDGLTHTSVKSLFINNVGITNTSNVGHNFMINNTTNTTIGVSNVNVWVKAAGTTTVGNGNSPKWTQPSSNRLLYGGIISADFTYNAVGTVQSATANQVISVAVAKNGTVQAESEITIRTAVANQPYPFAIQDVINIATGDFLEIFVLNTQSPDIRVGDLNVIIQKVNG